MFRNAEPLAVRPALRGCRLCVLRGKDGSGSARHESEAVGVAEGVD